MGFFAPLFIGLIVAIALPASVRNNPDTFGGMLAGRLVHIPFTHESIHLSIPVWIGVSLLVWFVLKLTR